MIKEDLRMSQRHALTDEQWNRIKDLVPGKPGDRGRSGENNRLFVDAVLYVLKTGVPWRDLPERFGNWNSVWRRFDRWCENGAWERIVKELCEYDFEEVQLDSTSIKVHLAAVGGRREGDEKKVMPIAAEVWGALGEV
ncbi:MAG: IS5 family transposase [Bacteroidetes bacterium]|nr:MAG: IS5 family transposase [Bacteroidota bacterium]